MGGGSFHFEIQLPHLVQNEELQKKEAQHNKWTKIPKTSGKD